MSLTLKQVAKAIGVSVSILLYYEINLADISTIKVICFIRLV